MLSGLRAAYAQAEGRAAPFYGLASALGVAIPLLVGALTGHADQASLAALGAYLVSFTAPEGPYGARARTLITTLAVVTIGSTFGGMLSGHPWVTVLVVPFAGALGVAVPWIGPPGTLALLLVAIRPPAPGWFYPGSMELLGGLLMILLFLAPWPAFRLRPLRSALGDAADAIAGMLDAVAQDIGAPDASPLEAVAVTDPDLAEVAYKPDWERRRREASEALNAARATYGLYRSPNADEPTRPERLIESLSRTLQGTVALRALVEAARRRPPRGDWELEAHVAITALAARLRLLAGAVSSSGEMPLGSAESRAVRRLARQTERLRRAGLAGDEDFVAVALVAQIRHTIDRISGTVESARRVVEAEVRLRPTLPEWAGRDAFPGDAGPIKDSVRQARRRLVKAARVRSPRFRQVGRVILAVAIAMIVSAQFNIPHGHWLTLTVLFSLRDTYGETVTRVVQRIGGTAIGAVIAALLLALAPGKVSAALIVFGFGLLAFSLRPVNHAYWMLFGTPLVMMLLDFSAPSDWKTAGVRIALTASGGLFALLAARILWPSGGASVLPAQLARLLSTHAELVREATEVVEEPVRRLPLDRLSAGEDAADAVTRTSEHLAHEPDPDTERIRRLRASVRAAQRIRDHVITVANMTREDLPDTGPVPEILDRVAENLEETADVLADYAESPEDTDADAAVADLADLSTELDDELADLDDHLSALTRRRRAELDAGVAIEEFTPLRHALLQAAGVRQALRTLRADAAELARTAIEATFSAPPDPETETETETGTGTAPRPDPPDADARHPEPPDADVHADKADQDEDEGADERADGREDGRAKSAPRDGGAARGGHAGRDRRAGDADRDEDGGAGGAGRSGGSDAEGGERPGG